jgi:hypothetical protein
MFHFLLRLCTFKMPHRKQDRHEHRAKIPDYADAQRYCNLSYPVNKSPSINTDTFVKFGHRPLYGSSRRYTSATEFSYPDSYEDLYTGNTRSQSPEYQSRRPLTAVDVDSTEEQHYYNAHYANSAPHYYSNEQPTKGTYFEGHFPSGRGSLYDYDKLIERNQLKSRPSKGGNPMWSRKSWFDRTYTQPALQQQTAQMHRRSRSPYDEPSRSEMHRQPKLRPTHETPQQIYSSFEDIRGPIYSTLISLPLLVSDVADIPQHSLEKSTEKVCS